MTTQERIKDHLEKASDLASELASLATKYEKDRRALQERLCMEINQAHTLQQVTMDLEASK